jgi:hypothetical protein
MRKALLLFSFLISHTCFSQGVVSIDSVNHNPTWAGDSLVIYFRAFGGNFWGIDSGTVYVEIPSFNVVASKPVVDIAVGNNQWTILFPNIPDTAVIMRFADGTGSHYDGFYIHIDNTLDIPIPVSHKILISKKYFSILGVEQFYPTGLLIEESKFDDGSVLRRKVYFE